jgi:autotransporter-associated beta strand protein
MTLSIKNILFTTLISFIFFGCSNPKTTQQNLLHPDEFKVELPKVSYPLPVVDYIYNNCNIDKKVNINENPVIYILRGINDIWQGTTDTYQVKSSLNGPCLTDYIKGNPIIDSISWKRNIQYVIEVTNNRTDTEAVLAYLDDIRSKYYSVADGFGPLTEDYVENSGVYVDLPEIYVAQVLKDKHYQSSYNNGKMYAGDEKAVLGDVVKLARSFQNTCSSTKAPKRLYATPRPWRMNNNGEVKFLGTTYDTILNAPTYLTIDYAGNKNYKIFDNYECDVKVVPGLYCSRKNHIQIYDETKPSSNDLYTNTTENIREDNGYPSGHTNAGMLISLAYAYAFPERFSELIYRGSQLGEDRIIAGMHSPVDVMGGKIMALSVACAALSQPEIAKEAETALEATFKFFGAKADSLGMNLYDYAHRKVDNPSGFILEDMVNTEIFNNNIYDEKKKIKEIYKERLTYGFPCDTTKNDHAPIVPKGAENILKSRFPYLTDNQRRLVLYTTEISSGYKLLDKTNGWGRINLLAAADGFGEFIGNVHINMDASLGRFNSEDTWGNDISGRGRLIKKGTGKLTLIGNNTFSGGTEINEGTISTISYTALGTGDVQINKKGVLEVYNSLKIAGSFSQVGGRILIHVTSKDTIPIHIDNQVKIKDSTLEIVLDRELKLNKGDKIAILKGKEVKAQIKNLITKEYKGTLEQIENTIYFLIL